MDIANCNQKVIKNDNHILHSFIYCVRYGKQRLNGTKLISESHLKFYQIHFLKACSCFYLFTILNIKCTGIVMVRNHHRSNLPELFIFIVRKNYAQ